MKAEVGESGVYKCGSGRKGCVRVGVGRRDECEGGGGWKGCVCEGRSR